MPIIIISSLYFNWSFKPEGKKKKQERQTERRVSGKQEMKLSLSEDKMFIYIQNPKPN